MIVNYDESIKYVSNQMKKNLELIKEEPITTFSFDINETYNPDEVKYKSLSSNLKTLPNFVGKTLKEANDYCKKNNLKCEISQSDLTKIVISQSIGANTDISTIRNKAITFEVDNDKEIAKNDKLSSVEEKVDNEKATDSEDENTTSDSQTSTDTESVPKDEETNNKENKENKEDLSEIETTTQ